MRVLQTTSVFIPQVSHSGGNAVPLLSIQKAWGWGVGLISQPQSTSNFHLPGFFLSSLFSFSASYINSQFPETGL